MKLDVSEAIRNPGVSYAFRVEQAMAPQDVSGDEVRFDPAALEGSFRATSDGTVTVSGTLHVTAHANCANCLRPASAKIQTDFEEDFLYNGDPEDDEIFAYSGGQIDLEKLTLTYAMLNLPMRFLCRSGCEGMQEYVAGDATVSLCQKELPGQHPFAALQRLLDDQESGQVDEGSADKD